MALGLLVVVVNPMDTFVLISALCEGGGGDCLPSFGPFNLLFCVFV